MKRLLCGLLLLLPVGCADPNMAMVHGVVTVDGEPAEMGSITFIPVDGMGSTTGGIIEDGKYSVESSIGTMKVQIRVSKVVGQQKIYNTADSPIQDILAEVLPEEFNDHTELTLAIVSGDNEKNYDLEAKKKRRR